MQSSMVHTGKIPYESPLCATIQLQHRELIATSLFVLYTLDAPSGADVVIEDITYDYEPF